MKIIHRISGKFNKDHQLLLAKFGIIVGVGHDAFEIEEGEIFYELWSNFNNPLFGHHFAAAFDSADINEAKYLVAFPTWAANGYPMPDNNNGYSELTFGKGNRCPKCGHVIQQKGCFYLKTEPNWKKRRIFGINWIFDAFFVPLNIYDDFFRPRNVDSKPVFLWKKDVPIPNLIQLVFPTSSAELVMENRAFEVCNVCGTKKYSPKNSGFLENFRDNPNIDVAITREEFGAGGICFHRLVVSQDFRQELISNGIKMEYEPMK